MLSTLSKIFCDKYACLATDRATRKYFSKVDVAEGILLVYKTPVYFTDARYFFALKDKLKGTDIEPVLYEGLDTVKRHIKNKKIKKLFIDYDKTTVSEFKAYKKLNVRLLNGKKEIEKLRSVKSEEELANVKKACEIIQNAYYKTLPDIKEGITEKELCGILQKNIAELGGEGESFSSIVAFGKNAAVPHHETGDTALKKDSVVLIDTGCVYKGYCSDLTRTLFFGKPNKEFTDCYKAVLFANEKAEKEITSGMKTAECDKIARDSLFAAGYGEFFTHSLGHGVGLDIHEAPYLSAKSKELTEENNVFTIEPGIYLEGKFGIRIEDTVVIKNGKIERLFTDDKQLLIL